MYNPYNIKNLLNKYKFGKYLFVGGFTFFCKRTYLARNIYCVVPRSMDQIILN